LITGFLYGDGIFEGIRFYNGRVFRLEEHLERLWDSAKAIRLKIPITLDEMREATLETIRQNHLKDGYIRLLVTRGKGNLGLSPDRCPKATVIIIADKIQLYPVEKYAQGMVMVTCATRRAAPAALLPAVKSLNYLNNVMAKVEATHAGADEGLMLNEQGYVAECTGDNIFVIKKGVVTTPPVYAGALCGITRNVVFEICADLEFPSAKPRLNLVRHLHCRRTFSTGTAAEVIAAIELDTRPIGDGKPGALTGKIIARFSEIAGSTGTPIHP
jgi:branched-chain amino acid aminotransferase